MTYSRREYLKALAATAGVATSGCVHNTISSPAELRWYKPSAPGRGYHEPVVHDDYIYWTTRHHTHDVVRLNKETGKANEDGMLGTDWLAQNEDTKFTSGPVIVGRGVYVGSEERGLLSMDPETGNLNWRYGGPEAPVYELEHGGGTVYALSDDGVLHAVESSTGTREWMYRLGDYNDTLDTLAFVIYSEGMVYAGGFDGEVYAIAEDGELEWSSSVAGTPWSGSVAVHDGMLLVAATSDDNGLISLDKDTGEVLWSHEGNSGYLSVGMGRIYATVSSDGADGDIATDILSLDGEELGSFGFAGPMSISGERERLYVGGDIERGRFGGVEGGLYAFDRHGEMVWRDDMEVDESEIPFSADRIMCVSSVLDDNLLYLTSNMGAVTIAVEI
jgi:outer membrane protein assembly factor BamB